MKVEGSFEQALVVHIANNPRSPMVADYIAPPEYPCCSKGVLQ